MPEEPSTCPTCDGDGLKGPGDDEFCDTCMGGGSVPVIGLSRYIKESFEDLVDKVNDVMDKCNDIFEKVDV